MKTASSGKTRKEIAIAAGVIGIIQSVVSLAFIICIFIFGGKNSGESVPYWSGLPLLLPGILGIVVLITKNQCVLLAFMINDIIVLPICAISAGVTSLASAIWKLARKSTENYQCATVVDKCACVETSTGLTVYYYVPCDDISSIATLLEMMTAMAILGLLLALAGAILGSAGVCCYKPETNTVMVAPAPVQPMIMSTTTTTTGQPPYTYPVPQHQPQQPGYPPPHNPGYPAVQTPGYPPSGQIQQNAMPPQGHEQCPPPPTYPYPEVKS